MPLDRNTLKELMTHLTEDTQKIIELEIYDFLRENRNHLPFYHIPKLHPEKDNIHTTYLVI